MRPAFGGPHRIAGETGRRGARRSRGMRSGSERGSSRIHAALGARRSTAPSHRRACSARCRMRARHALKAHACRADAAEAEAAKRATPIHARRAGPLPSPATIMRAAPLVTMHHDVRRRRRTHSVPRLPAFPPSRLPAFQPSSLPAFQPSSLPAFQDDRRAPPLFFRHAPSRSASRMSPRLGAIAHDPPVARDSIRAADAGGAASPEPRSRAAPRKTGQRNAPPVAPPTCRHADTPTRRTAATAALPHCRHCRRSPAKPLVLTRQATQPHTHSATGVPSAFHRHSIGAPSTSAQTTNAQRRTRAIATPRAARRECARDRPPHRASRHPGLLLNAFSPWITPSSARPCSSEPSHASTIASRSKSLYGADSRAACRVSTP
ncbi:hypothetical protein X879_5915 [Burkholderia pseudomallei MSHR3951]|nr:hypothetical protein X944_6048 [Burkholderia pseudomallei MSHR3964]KGV83232.1 hypothetical protein X892_5993 [Burkholderia pseudomallei MSHR3960]KGV96580.1 hypothetical protein X879_5915 [Burkholderia pseudomallei MSHR3951]